MLLDSETVILKQSRSFGSMGGDILRSEEELHGLEKSRFNVTSEDAFFNNVIYKGYYVKNNSNQRIKNIDITISGGMRDPLGNETVPKNDLDVRNTLDNRAILRYHHPEFEEELYERYKLRQEPYLPTEEEMTALIGRGLSERDAFNQWLINNIYLSGYARSSIFNQTRISLLISSRRVLSTFDESGEGKALDLKNLIFKDSNLRSTIPVDLEPGEYWGFYVRFETRFIPSQLIKKDLALLHINWQESDNTMHVSQPVRFGFETEFNQMIDMQNESLERIYMNYPPFFMHYLDIEES